MANDVSIDDANKWSNLLPDLLHLIAFEFDNDKDLLTFRSVCNSWRSVAMADARLTPFPPLLLVPYDKSDDIREFQDLSSCGSVNVTIPESVGKLIIGTAHGFLILLSSSENSDGSGDGSVSLFNPITRSHIHLPVMHLRKNCRCMTSFRALLSSHPRSDPPPVLAIWAYNELFFLTLGDDHWRSSHHTDCYNSIEGVFAYCHDSFFLSYQYNAKIEVIDARSLELSELDVPLEEYMYCNSYRMILFSGDLFLVVSNYYDPKPCEYKAYATYKLVKESMGQSQSKWRWLKEDYSNNECVTRGSVFFLDEYLSVAIVSPDRVNYLTNCTYNGFIYYWKDEARRHRTRHSVCTAAFNLPSTMYAYDSWYKNNVINDEIWDLEDSDEDDEYWSMCDYSNEENDLCPTKKVRRCKEDTVYCWFIPDPH